MRVGVVVTAAGAGTRLGVGYPKALLVVDGQTLVQRAVRAARAVADEIVVTAPASHLEEFRSLLPDDVAVVPGGQERQDSVRSALAALGGDVTHVLVHDAARAFTPEDVFRCVVAALRDGASAAIPALPVVDTVKEVDGAQRVVRTPPRAYLRAVQTPQGFERGLLVRAHAQASGPATDDAALVEALGEPVLVVPGDPAAHKITAPSDVRALREGAQMTPLVGIGTDTHAFGGEGDLSLACLTWPGQPRLAGHSDGDVAVHAAIDAVLSAAGLGDIGTLLGTDRPEWAGATGARLLKECADVVAQAGFTIGNVAVQVVGVRPRLAPRRQEAAAAMSAALGAPVRVSATTTDGLGFTGRGEGLTALATAVVWATH